MAREKYEDLQMRYKRAPERCLDNTKFIKMLQEQAKTGIKLPPSNNTIVMIE